MSRPRQNPSKSARKVILAQTSTSQLGDKRGGWMGVTHAQGWDSFYEADLSIRIFSRTRGLGLREAQIEHLLVTMCGLHAMWGPGGHTRPLLRVKVGQWPSDGTGAQNSSSRVSHLVTSGQSCRVNETNHEIKHIRISSGRIELNKRQETLWKNIELGFKSTNCPTKETH